MRDLPLRSLRSLRERKEWQFFTVLHRADARLAGLWWAGLALRGLLPAGLTLAVGAVVGAVEGGHALAWPLAAVGAVFVAMQVLNPIHTAVSANLGDRTAAWLYDRLTEACVQPPGLAHLEDPELARDMTVARDFDLGQMGPPLSLSVGFIA